MSSITYRNAEPHDFAITYDIATEAMTDFRVRQHQIKFHRPPSIQPRDLAMRQHCYQFHHDGFWVAEHGSRIFGFGFAVRQPGCWYLAGLHVLPSYQGQGIGRRLLDLTLSTAQPSDIRCCVTDEIQVAAKRLYSRVGMPPWVPLLEWEGDLPTKLPDTTDDTIHLTQDPKQLEDIDRQVLDLSRPNEHTYWLQQPGMVCGLLTVDGEPVGYVYVLDAGDIGPLAVTEESLARPLLAWALQQLKDRGADHIHLKIPGDVPVVQEIVATLGLTSREPASALLSSQPLWTAGQYLLSSGDSIL
jgi:GNAT superfamily N-acetyltransferase